MLKIRSCTVFHMRSFCSRKTSVSCCDRSDINIEISSRVVQTPILTKSMAACWPICIAVVARVTHGSHFDRNKNDMSKCHVNAEHLAAQPQPLKKQILSFCKPELLGKEPTKNQSKAKAISIRTLFPCSRLHYKGRQENSRENACGNVNYKWDRRLGPRPVIR
jgi:hypothetical protein